MEAGTAFVLVAIALGIIFLGVLLTFVPVMLWISALAKRCQGQHFHADWYEIEEGYPKQGHQSDDQSAQGRIECNDEPA